MNFFNCLANDWADITDMSSSGSEFHKHVTDSVKHPSMHSMAYEHHTGANKVTIAAMQKLQTVKYNITVS